MFMLLLEVTGKADSAWPERANNSALIIMTDIETAAFAGYFQHGISRYPIEDCRDVCTIRVLSTLGWYFASSPGLKFTANVTTKSLSPIKKPKFPSDRNFITGLLL